MGDIAEFAARDRAELNGAKLGARELRRIAAGIRKVDGTPGPKAKSVVKTPDGRFVPRHIDPDAKKREEESRRKQERDRRRYEHRMKAIKAERAAKESAKKEADLALATVEYIAVAVLAAQMAEIKGGASS